MRAKSVIFSILLIAVVIGCSKSASSPEDVVKAVLENVIKGNYEAALGYWVDSNGNPISQETRQTMLNSMQSNAKLSSYTIKGVTDANSFLEQTQDIPQSEKDKVSEFFKAFEEVKVVTVTLSGETTYDTPLFVVKHKGSWKILVPQ